MRHSQHRIGHSLFLLGAFVFLLCISVFGPLSTGATKAFGSSELISLTNKARTQLGGEELVVSTKLTNAAQTKAEDMVKQRFFAHTAPDGTMAWDYLKKVGYTYEVAGENLAITNESAETVVASWMDSPSHRDNIINKEYRDIGIGMATFGDYQGNKDTTVIVALYGKPSGGTQVVGAATNPAGGAAVLKPSYTSIPTSAIIPAALIVMLFGAVLELRHIRKMHHKL